MKTPKLIGPLVQMITLSGLPIKGALKDEQLEVIENAGILILNDKIIEIGDYKTLLRTYRDRRIKKIEVKGAMVALPSWIDCHTHICFAGSRAKDFAMRNAGKSYLEIAKAGGGIWDTVQSTRAADIAQLKKLTASRIQRHLKAGITTIEIKSGYGLMPSQELKMLSTIQMLKTPADLIPTCLAAHMKPKDFIGSNEAYLSDIQHKLFPMLKTHHLSNRVDAFVEQSAFTPEEITPYLLGAKAQGFDITIHADQFTTGGSALAIKLGAKSADHLEVSGENEIQALAKSDVVSVALPGASLGIGCAFTPARKILDAGGALAIASDWNPGSAPMGNLIAQASVLAAFEKLSTAEVFAGLTFRAASALGLSDRGVLAPGMLADFNLYAVEDYQEILYQQGQLAPVQVWKKGALVKFKEA
ncbi:imidazolonepropionase [Algoriphagus marinus]|uniref:imidazolonepropionase n=1 Tax=Algoriphagus marinus TaxID=1925762 RepID=UPI00094BAAB5|nr:imidazolonepropionase [Algoriphagus marinus]